MRHLYWVAWELQPKIEWNLCRNFQERGNCFSFSFFNVLHKENVWKVSNLFETATFLLKNQSCRAFFQWSQDLKLEISRAIIIIFRIYCLSLLLTPWSTHTRKTMTSYEIEKLEDKIKGLSQIFSTLSI